MRPEIVGGSLSYFRVYIPELSTVRPDIAAGSLIMILGSHAFFLMGSGKVREPNLVWSSSLEW